MHFQWVGGPTFLLRLGQFSLLSDPMFGTGPAAFIMHGHPSTGADHAPIARLADLPLLDLADLDAILVSHLHTDHFDAVAKARLNKQTPVIAPESHVASLRASGFQQLHGVAWWQQVELTKANESLRILAVPARHSANEAVNAELGIVNGYLLFHRTPEIEQRVYWTGDTVWFDELARVYAALGRPHLLVPHLGAVGVDGPWGRMTLDAVEAVRLVELFEPETVIPIHHSTFSHYVEPISTFVSLLGQTPHAASLLMLQEGAVWELR